jgi:hypothetical protein
VIGMIAKPADEKETYSAFSALLFEIRAPVIGMIAKPADEKETYSAYSAFSAL